MHFTIFTKVFFYSIIFNIVQKLNEGVEYHAR